MESYMTEKTTIDGHVIEGIEMLDDDTCCLYFEDETENDNKTIKRPLSPFIKPQL